ncbi:MAG: hypothetical protein FWH46_00040 [Methanimicrococcus sp.]|nr:hypothetical protein [Methanimicrococcus sp.]
MTDMDDVKIEYCWDGYNCIEEKITSLEQLEMRLNELKKTWAIEHNSSELKCIATVDVVIENVGYISISLDEKCILLFYDEVEDYFLTSLGNPSFGGSTEDLYDFGQPAESSNQYIVSYKDGLDALKDWIVTKKLSQKIEWTDKIF